jgi:hypothetical protein
MTQARRDLLKLFVLSLIVRLVVAGFISRPGYMDPAYYAATAVSVARGGGLQEPFIWNYLNDPAGIPHPGFLYWMPLPALLAAPFATLFPGSFFALQVPLAVLSALLPLTGYGVAWHVAKKRWLAWSAGLLVLFSGYFFPYWTLPETFAPYALFGSLALWLAGCGKQGAGGRRWLISCLVGVLVGLAHLTRADGILLLPVVFIAPLSFGRSRDANHASRIVHHVSSCVLIVVGYALVMTPWFVRNMAVTGSPLASGGTKTLWLTNYDDLYCYGCDLSLQSYLAWGWGNILSSKLSALGVNLQRFLAENCLVFLLPLAIIGFYRLRRRAAFVNSLVYLALIFLAHTLAFTYPGPRGGFFHASSAILPFLFVAAMEGLEGMVRWVGQRRRWNVRQAVMVFATAAVLIAAVLSVYVANRVLPQWQGTDRAYERIGQWMEQRGVDDRAIVMVNNPPAFWYYTRRPAVAVPAPVGDVDTLLAAADRYGVDYVVLDRNWPIGGGGMINSRLREIEGWGEESTRVVLYEVMAR